MNKQELIDQVARKARLTKRDARTAVDAALGLIVDGVRKGDKVTLTGFGTFEAYRQKASRRFNPQTRRPMQVPAKTVPKFRAGKGFREALSKRR